MGRGPGGVLGRGAANRDLVTEAELVVPLPGSCGHFRLGGVGQNLGSQALSWVDAAVGRVSVPDGLEGGWKQGVEPGGCFHLVSVAQ